MKFGKIELMSNEFDVGKNLTVKLRNNSGQIEFQDDGGSWTPLSFINQNVTTTGTPTFSNINLSGKTQGSVLFQGASGISQDNDNLFWDDTNNRLGIGTATPSATLDIQSLDNIIATFKTASNIAGIRIRDLSNSLYIGTSGSFGYLGSDNFKSANNFIVDLSTNYFGIGTTTPSAKLDVNGNIKALNGTSINEFSTDGTLADNSDDAVPTEKAVKTYVDQVADTHVIQPDVAVADDEIPTFDTDKTKLKGSGASVTVSLAGGGVINLPDYATDPSSGNLTDGDLYIVDNPGNSSKLLKFFDGVDKYAVELIKE